MVMVPREELWCGCVQRHTAGLLPIRADASACPMSIYLLICLIQGLGLNEQELEMRSILVRVQQVLKITFSFFELLK